MDRGKDWTDNEWKSSQCPKKIPERSLQNLENYCPSNTIWKSSSLEVKCKEMSLVSRLLVLFIYSSYSVSRSTFALLSQNTLLRSKAASLNHFKESQTFSSTVKFWWSENDFFSLSVSDLSLCLLTQYYTKVLQNEPMKLSWILCIYTGCCLCSCQYIFCTSTLPINNKI